ncbi:MAG: zf-TFIIB domain-containing protein [Myxococcales bacterium]|nr:zf-TFIIB domain-containing protein [Myxococcales bacterium]
MGSCPACVSMPLSGYEASPGVDVELCAHCRGLFLDRDEIRALVGRGSLAKVTEVVPLLLGEQVGMRCPKCVDPAMQPIQIKGASDVRSWQCRACGGLWLGDGAFFELARALRASLPAARIVAPSVVSLGPPVIDGSGLTHSRSRYDEGMENLIAVPLVLSLSVLLCSTEFGRLLASLVGMPFHELGHAAASWLSSRIAIPLPFFTFWFDDQSAWMGLLVAGVLGWLIFHTRRERNRFMFAVAWVLLSAWAVITFFIPASRTLMWQILAGALGELVFGAFILIAFHFPLPDRLRWDFWRWVALIPASLCFTHAMILWHGVSADVSQMPWGSAVGSESDGDMNRLVQQFGWSANDLADFYLTIGYLGVAALGMAYPYAVVRLLRTRRQRASAPGG